jgi:hypothetical protein
LYATCVRYVGCDAPADRCPDGGAASPRDIRRVTDAADNLRLDSTTTTAAISVIIANMGPFKINVDDGADIRRLAVSAVAIMFDHHGRTLCLPPLPPPLVLLGSIIAHLSDKWHDVLLAAHALFFQHVSCA